MKWDSIIVLGFMLAPAFTHTMCDLAQNFNCKTRVTGRATLKAPALVFTCIITGACGINMCEDWSTVSVLQAIERHSSRYGIPSFLYVDSGSQLLKLKEVHFSIRDLGSKLQSKLCCTLVTAPPKSHSHQGKVERKIGLIKDILDKINEPKFLLSFLGWETILARIANHLNNLPICKASSRSTTVPDYNILTPNRLLLGRNNSRALTGPLVLESSPSTALERLCQVEECFFSNKNYTSVYS